MPLSDPDQAEERLQGGGRTVVHRRGTTVLREAGPWSIIVMSLLKHLDSVGFSAAPRVAGSGFDDLGRETLTYIDGGFVHPGPWQDEALPLIGRMLKALHQATESFKVPPGAVWRPWFGRDLGNGKHVIGHCDTGPWNIVAAKGLPVALIDWEEAGPVDPMVELAQACWLNAQLHDDDIAERVGLPSVNGRVRQMRLLLDGYGLSHDERTGFVDRMVEFAIRDAADQAIAAKVTPDTRNPEPLWAVTWRARSAAWMLRNRKALEAGLT